MKKSFLSLLIISLFLPIILIAQTGVSNLPQDVQNYLNETPGLSEELNKLYNQPNNSGYQEQLSFSVSPSVPRPGQTVLVTVSGFSSNLSKLQISWYLNGVLVKKEIGATKHEFTIGGLGEQTNIRVSILKSNGEVLEKTYSFRPAEVDLIYEAQTFTPPFYAGSAYFTRQSNIKVVAMPQVLNRSGSYINPNTLSYRWYLGGDFVQDQSGYGKNTFSYKSSVISTGVKIGVEISTLDDGAVANASINLNPTFPEVVFYEKNPVLGVLYNSAIQNLFSMSTPEVEFEVVPYFFNKESVLNRSTVYNWRLNGSKIDLPNQNSIVFRNEKNEEGEAIIGISISNGTLLQKAEKSFKLIFNTPNLNEIQF